MTATFTNTGANNWDYSLSIPATDLSAAGATGVIATGTLTFNGNGVLTGDTATTGGTVTGALSDVTGIPITGFADGASNMTFNWNVLNGTSPVLTQVAAANSTTFLHQDGTNSGSLATFSIGSDGTITGSFSNGKTQALGQIALASQMLDALRDRVPSLGVEERRHGQAVPRDTLNRKVHAAF